MQTKTEIDRAALMASIEKWERNAVADRRGDALMGPAHCPLCELYIDKDCDGCPIYAKSSTRYCGDTPYRECEQSRDLWDLSDDFQGAFQAAARAEVDFLRAVLAELPE